MFPLKTILHPTDFSECSRPAFELACRLAGQDGARLILLHVTTVPDLAYRGYGLPGSPLLVEEYRRDVCKRLEVLQPPHPSVPVERRLAEGDPAEEILRTARETGADLIVLGTHGQTGLRELLMGSGAGEVVRNATCPVLTLKVPARRTAAP
jgi:nucleotide-binding universal stress UspA family protein